LILDFLLGVARAYYAAAATQQAVGVADRALGRARDELAITETQAAVGENLRARLVAARIAVSQAETAIKRAANAHEQSLIALAVLTRSPERPDVVTPTAPIRPTGDRDALTKMAMEHREELRAAIASVTIADRSRDEVWWRFAPTLSLFGGYRYSNVQGISGQNEQWSLGLNASLLLYDGGLRYQDLAEAESHLRIAEAALQGLHARIESEVEQAILRVDAADMAIDHARDDVLLTHERMKLAHAEHEAGALRVIELKAASDAALDAELGMIQAEMNRALATLELQRAIGAFAP
jgi:OMF family outer membrane factor